MNKSGVFILLSVLFLFCISLTSAEVQSLPDAVKTSSCVVLPQLYANSTFQNISTIQLPDETILSIYARMTSLGGGFYNYSFCNTTQNGKYIVNGFGDIDGTVQAWNYDFTVNPLGKVFTSQQAILYFLVLIVAFILFIITGIWGIYAPSTNSRDQVTGYIIAVDNTKYVKIFMLCLSYLLLMLIMYFSWMISYGYLDMDFLGNLFNFAFIVMVSCLFPLFLLGVYILVTNVIRDNKIGESLARGLHVR